MIRRCYTLFELIAASAILLVMLGVAIGSFAAIQTGESPERFAERFRAAAVMARRQAAAQNLEQCIRFTPENRRFSFEPKPLTLPEHLELRVDAKVPEAECTILRFFPDGSAAERLLEFGHGEESIRIHVSPLTGAMEWANDAE